MAADFWAGYVSGVAGIVIGNPLDLLKTRLQASSGAPVAQKHFDKIGTLVRGAPAPILGYGALNAILFATYNRSLSLITTGTPDYIGLKEAEASLSAIWVAGAVGGLATFGVSAPTELVKCRAQVWHSSSSGPPELFSFEGAKSGERFVEQGEKGSEGKSLRRAERAQVGQHSVSSIGIAREIWATEGVRGFFRGGAVTSVRDAVGYGF